jgi:hypothetical protein
MKLALAAPKTELFDLFVNSDEVPAPSLSPWRFVEVMHLDIQTLADQAKVHRNTVGRAPQSFALQYHMRQALRVLAAGREVSGDLERAITWYRNEPLSPFDYKTAEQLVSENRTDDVIRFLKSVGARAAG